MNMGCATVRARTETRRAGSGKDGTLDGTAAVTGRENGTLAAMASVIARKVRNLASASFSWWLPEFNMRS